MALMGAEILFYPTAIGSEPTDPSYDSKDHWQICMQGHAAANMVPVVVSNRVGHEAIDKSELTFYGSSFFTDHRGQILQEADRSAEGVIVQEFDLEAVEDSRRRWALFRDRRPDMYHFILTNDGSNYI
jgi:N-carbamoylputrescine amidase